MNPPIPEHNLKGSDPSKGFRGQTPLGFWSLTLWLYQLGFLAFGILYLGLRLLRGRPLPGLRERLAIYPQELKKELFWGPCPIWVHLVSVGEVLAARPLIEELRRRFPAKGWMITTVTPTGRKVAEPLVRPGKDCLLYLPWDFTPVVQRAVRTIRPCLFLSFETELWPVLFRELGRQRIPIAVVNGRISPAAYGRYLWVRPWMEAVLSDVSFFFTQSPQDARRYAAIGAAKDRIVVTGNLKWDLDPERSSNGAAADLKRLLGLEQGSSLWTAGSTHRGEERTVLQAYSFLVERFPGLRLLIAPRHPERVVEVEQLAKGMGLAMVRRSDLKGSDPAGSDPIVLLDTLGELPSIYQISDIVFVGGSLIPHGGHNLVEPAAFGRPILTGPYLQNFEAISNALRQAGGIAVVKSSKELEQRAGWLLENPRAAQEMGSKAFAVIQEHRGAARRTADLLALKWGARLAGKA